MSQTPTTPEAATPPPPPAPADPDGKLLSRVALVVIIGALMPVLDATVVNVALNTLSSDLSASLPTIQWVVTAYLLSLAVVIPLSGWAMDRFGPKPVWIASLLGFIVGSVLCGVAWNAGSLIAFRVLQGFGGGMIMPVAQTMMATVAGPKRMGRAMSLLGIAILLGPVLGPIVGGLLVEDASWRWIFLINPPIGLLGVYLAYRLLPNLRAPRRSATLDLPGLALLSAALVALLYGLSKASSAGGFSGGTVIGCLVTGGLLLVVFVLYSLRRGTKAIIDVAMYRNRVFSIASLITLLLGVGMYGALLLLPLYYQVVRGEGTLKTGLLVVPMGLGAAVAMPVVGRIIDMIGSRIPMLVGLVLFLSGTLAFTQAGPDTSYVWLSLALFVSGVGLGCSTTPNMVATYAALPPDAVPRASGAYNILRQVGGSLGSALLAITLTRNVNDVLPGSAAGGLHHIGSAQGGQRHVEELLGEAFRDTFWVAFGLTAVMLLPALFLPNARRPERPVAR